MQLDKGKLAILLALLATVFTGMYVPIVNVLSDNNRFNSVEIAAIRAIVCVLVVGIVLLIFSRESFKIDKRDIWIFVVFGLAQLAYGIFGIAAINQQVGGLNGALGSALQSTSPYFTIVLAYFMFKERITLNKVVAICIGFIGCLLATGLFSGSIEAKVLGIVLAILSAIFVAIFNIGSKYVGDRGYSTETTLFYFYLVNAIVLLPYAIFKGTFSTAANSGTDVWMAILAIGIISTAIPQFLTIKAFQIGDTGKVSVVLMFDIVTSAIICWLVLGQTLGIVEIIGLLLVILSLIIIELNIGGKKDLVGKGEPTE